MKCPPFSLSTCAHELTHNWISDRREIFSKFSREPGFFGAKYFLPGAPPADIDGRPNGYRFGIHAHLRKSKNKRSLRSSFLFISPTFIQKTVRKRAGNGCCCCWYLWSSIAVSSSVLYWFAGHIQNQWTICITGSIRNLLTMTWQNCLLF